MFSLANPTYRYHTSSTRQQSVCIPPGFFASVRAKAVWLGFGCPAFRLWILPCVSKSQTFYSRTTPVWKVAWTFIDTLIEQTVALQNFWTYKNTQILCSHRGSSGFHGWFMGRVILLQGYTLWTKNKYPRELEYSALRQAVWDFVEPFTRLVSLHACWRRSFSLSWLRISHSFPHILHAASVHN